MTVEVNFLAIVVCAFISIVLGFMWYGPLFGKKWMALSGIVMPDVKPSMKMMIKPMIISVIGAFFMAFVLKHDLTFGNAYLGMSGISSGLMAAFWNWLGFVVPVTLSAVAWEKSSWTLWMIHAGYWLVLMLIMGAILVSWI